MDRKNFQELKQMIFDSELSFSEKEDLGWLFADATDEEILAARELFTEDKEWIKILSDNYHSKKMAFLADDPQMWKNILESEKQIIQKTTKK